MIERIPERPPLKPLDWRKLMPPALVAAFDSVQHDEEGNPDAEKYKDVSMTLDRIAQEAAHRGVNVEAMAKEALEKIEREKVAGLITEGQAHFMKDESDPLLRLIKWAHQEGLVDDVMRTTLHEAVN